MLLDLALNAFMFAMKSRRLLTRRLFRALAAKDHLDLAFATWVQESAWRFLFRTMAAWETAGFGRGNWDSHTSEYLGRNVVECASERRNERVYCVGDIS